MKPKVSSSKKWEILSEFRVQNSEFKIDSLIKVLLANRGIKTKREIEEFVDPKLENVTVGSVEIKTNQLKKAVVRIKKAIDDKEQIIVFGDYDVDGICGTAILWETLHSLGAKVMPYIPHRIEEGYGLSIKGLNNVINTVMPNSLASLRSGFRHPKKILKQAFGSEAQARRVQDDKEAKGGLIITVDNGIVANEAVEFASKHGIDVIITDHHVPPAGGTKKLPNAHAIVHTTKLCGAGVAYLLAQELKAQSAKRKITHEENNHLELVALATVADLVPLLGANRTLLTYGLKKLRQTKRPGLRALFEEAQIHQKEIGVWEVGHVIAPRLNAMGRIEYAMDSLRLLCTKDKTRAKKLADLLGKTNRERQQLTIETTQHAVAGIKNNESGIRKLLFVAHESYQQGVIGLVAGKLVEEYYRPAIVVSKGEKFSKASARSIHGFNIIEFIRSASEFLVDAGGHPMAAGFTVETEKLPLLEKALHDLAHKSINADKLVRSLRIDCELPLPLVSNSLYDELEKLAPFGMGSPEPTFVSRSVVIEDMRVVGQDGKHLKLRLQQLTINNQQSTIFDAIAFGMGERANELHVGDKVEIVYTIDQDLWNGNKRLQLKIKDIKRENKI